MKKVSIIIPLYNRASLIRETLDSLSATLHPGSDLEIIVADDGSSDGGDLLVEQHYPGVLLLRQKNAGASAARNNGLLKATGEYVLFLDSDDLIEPDFFTKKIALLEKTPEASAVYGPWEHFMVTKQGQHQIIPRHTPYPLEAEPGYENHLRRLLSGWYIICHALLWRRSALLDLKGYDTSLPVNQDVDLLFRSLIKKNKLAGVSSPKALYRDHTDQHRIGTINHSAKLKSILDLRKKFAEELEKENLLTSDTKKALAEFCFNFWATYRKTHPGISEEFYLFAKQLKTPIVVRGGLIYKLAGKILGARNAVILKSYIQ